MTSTSMDRTADGRRSKIDTFARAVVGGWFLLLSVASAVNLLGTSTGIAELTYLDEARIASRLCLISFLAMMGYLSATRGKPLDRASGWLASISAFLGTNLMFCAALFLKPRNDLTPDLFILSAVLLLCGHAFAVYTLLHLGRSFSLVAESHRAVFSGPYRLVRHPLYLAEEIAILGIFIQYLSAAAFCIVVLHLVVQIVRMLIEEQILSGRFPDYAAYLGRTKRLIPFIW